MYPGRTNHHACHVSLLVYSVRYLPIHPHPYARYIHMHNTCTCTRYTNVFLPTNAAEGRRGRLVGGKAASDPGLGELVDASGKVVMLSEAKYLR